MAPNLFATVPYLTAFEKIKVKGFVILSSASSTTAVETG